MIEHINDDHKPVIYHLGDHDPSGVDITDDIRNRLDLFIGDDDYRYEEDWELHRIALNIDQIREFNPPPQPAKPGDSRTEEYEAQYGSDCWELDSMEPVTINALIEKHVRKLIDPEKWKLIADREAECRRVMQKAVDEMEL